ncbi:MAG: hypothetical protein LBU22_00375 [Dysgonamonadaceae bacterium]|jgi:hypothetical protein|nr:hypothetical protein [Dysgonamonadaceae bacterium]
MTENTELPEFIAGIPTDKNSVRQRREIIIKAYQSLLSKLMNETKKKVIRNDYLDVDVHLIMHEGGKEATNRGTFNWQSTYAILKLETIVKYAAASEGDIIYIPAKATGNQNEHKYVNLAVLYYDFVDEEKLYMNFRVKLILGIKNDGRHVQYSVNKIDVVNK